MEPAKKCLLHCIYLAFVSDCRTMYDQGRSTQRSNLSMMMKIFTLEMTAV